MQCQQMEVSAAGADAVAVLLAGGGERRRLPVGVGTFSVHVVPAHRPMHRLSRQPHARGQTHWMTSHFDLR